MPGLKDASVLFTLKDIYEKKRFLTTRHVRPIARKHCAYMSLRLQYPVSTVSQKRESTMAAVR